MPEYLKLEDVRGALKITKNTLYRWRREGKIAFTLIGGRNYINAAELDRFIASMPYAKPAEPATAPGA